MSMSNYKIIYSLKINIKLQSLGFTPITTMPNLQKPGFICWVYEETPELLKAFDNILKEDKK